MSDGPCYSLRRIVGTGWTEELLSACVGLPAGVREIKEIRKTVLVDRTTVTLDSVILEGRLRAQYTCAQAPPAAVIALSADHAYVVRIPIPGVVPDMRCTVVDAFVTGQAVQCVAAGPPGDGACVQDRSIIRLAIRVWVEEVLVDRRDEVVCVQPQKPATVICTFCFKGGKPH